MADGIDLGIPDLSKFREVGSGGFATVYAAWDEGFNRTVAVKVLHSLDADGRRRFDRERGIMGQLSGHDNVLTPYRFGYTNSGAVYLIMEYVEGGSLHDLVVNQGPVRWQQAVDYMLPIADALGHGHTQGILHRDVKPANILLTAKGVPKLTDFGIAAITESTSTQTAFTLAHAPPETFSGGRDSRDERSDLYSLASTLFTLVAGRTPFHVDGETSQVAHLYRIEHHPVPPLGVHPPLDAFLTRSMAKSPADRQASALEFMKELAQVQNPTSPTFSLGPIAGAGGAPATMPVVPGTAGPRTDPSTDPGAHGLAGAGTSGELDGPAPATILPTQPISAQTPVVGAGPNDRTATIDLDHQSASGRTPVVGTGGPSVGAPQGLHLGGPSAAPPGQGPPSGPAPYAAPGKNRQPFLIGAIAAAVLAIVAIGGVLLLSNTGDGDADDVAAGPEADAEDGADDEAGTDDDGDDGDGDGQDDGDGDSDDDLDDEDATTSSGSTTTTTDDGRESTTTGDDTTTTRRTTTTVRQVEVPAVVQQSQSEAVATLERAGFTNIVVSGETSSDIAAGLAIRTNPSRGQTVSPSDRITLFISEGQGGVEVPALVGLSRAAAEVLLQDLGFVPSVEVVLIPPGGGQDGNVISQSPAGGTFLPIGSGVTIQIAMEETTTTTSTTTVVDTTTTTTTEPSSTTTETTEPATADG